MQTPLCKIGPGGDYTRDTLTTGPCDPLADLHAAMLLTLAALAVRELQKK